MKGLKFGFCSPSSPHLLNIYHSNKGKFNRAIHWPHPISTVIIKPDCNVKACSTAPKQPKITTASTPITFVKQGCYSKDIYIVSFLWKVKHLSEDNVYNCRTIQSLICSSLSEGRRRE